MVAEGEWYHAAVFCEQCGAEMILGCPSCQTPIRGHKNSGGFGVSPYEPPAHCYSCGAAMPWSA